MSRLLRLVVIASACWLLPSESAYACVCGGSPEAPTPAQLTRTLKVALDAARAVFVGESVAGNALTIRFRVASVWKGDLGAEVVMSTGAEATEDGSLRINSCDYSFSLGRSYLVFARGETTETMKAQACGFTGLQDTTLLDLLDRVTPRRPPSPSTAARALVAVLGDVRNPGVIEWTQSLTVQQALALAGGVVPPKRSEFMDPRRGSFIRRWRVGASPEEHPASLTATLLPDDELIVVNGPAPRGP